MTEKLYDIDSHIKEFTATVIDSCEKADGFVTVLDRTAFFPEGGGQASDTGCINGIRVYDVQIEDGVIYHYTDKPLTKGETVNAILDWERRFDFMQQHSAEHIVSGVAHSLYGCENVGFHLGADIVTLDFDKELTAEQILTVEKAANEAVCKNVVFKTWYPDKETLKTLSYRSKKELEGDVRIVEIEDIDCCACCAPHVGLSGQIGLIKLLGAQKMRGGTRIELKAGSRALRDYNEKYNNVRKISSLLCVQQNETAEAVERILEQMSNLRYEIASMKRFIVEEKINRFCKSGNITAEFEEGLEIKDLQYFADALYKKCGGVRSVFSATDTGFAFAICGEETELAKFFADFKANFTVKGGGRGNMVQGTVLAETDALEKFFATFKFD